MKSVYSAQSEENAQLASMTFGLKLHAPIS